MSEDFKVSFFNFVRKFFVKTEKKINLNYKSSSKAFLSLKSISS